MSSYMPWKEGARAARDAEARRGRLVGKDGTDDSTSFASGMAACTSCSTPDDAGRMMRGEHGLVCEACYFAQEAKVSPGRTWLPQAVGAAAPLLLGGALLLILAWALAYAAPPTGSVPTLSMYGGSGGGGPIHFPLLAGGLFGISAFFAWPLSRLFRSHAGLHGLTPGLHRALSSLGVGALFLSILGFVLSVILVLALLPPIPGG